MQLRAAVKLYAGREDDRAFDVIESLNMLQNTVQKRPELHENAVMPQAHRIYAVVAALPCNHIFAHLAISISWLHVQTRASIEYHPRELAHISIGRLYVSGAAIMPTWTLHVANDTTGGVVHELHSDLGHTSARACSLSEDLALTLQLHPTRFNS